MLLHLFWWMHIHLACTVSRSQTLSSLDSSSGCYMLTLSSGFDSTVMFWTLYKPSCLKALQISYECQAFVDFQCQCIENHLRAMFAAMDHHLSGSAQFHQDNLRDLKVDWAQLKSNTICLSCLEQKSEYVLICGHAVCDICVQIFGQALPASEYHYSMRTCTLCQSEFLTARLKLPTAGYQILSVDGREPQGIIPLEFMGLIQDLICKCPLQDLFNDAWGTSSGRISILTWQACAMADMLLGGLIVLSLFLLGWDVSHCIWEFDRLVKQFFIKKRKKSHTLLDHLHCVLKCWISDDYYDVSTLETMFKKCFDETQWMFDTSSSVSEMKVGVIATTISDASFFVFSNYNGLGVRNKESGEKRDFLELNSITDTSQDTST